DQTLGVEAGSVVLPADHVAKPRQRIGDRIEGDDKRDRFVAGARVERVARSDDRGAGVLGDAGLEPGQERQLAAARAADDADAAGIDAQAPGGSADVTYARRDVRAGGRRLVRRGLAGGEPSPHDAPRREAPAVHGAGRPVVAAPCSAVHVDESWQRPLSLAFRPVEAGEKLLAFRFGERPVLLVDLVRSGLIESDFHRDSSWWRRTGRTSAVKRSSWARGSSPTNRIHRSLTPAARYRSSAAITQSAGPRPIVPRECTPPP